jgi:hypothetical protein
MRGQLDIPQAGSLTESHMRSRARKWSGNIAASNLWGKVTAVGDVMVSPFTWVSQQYWIDRKGNAWNEYNPAYTTEWSYYLRFKGSGAKDGIEFGSLKESFSTVGDVGYGFGCFGVAEAGNYRLKFELLQTNTPGVTRAGVVEVLGCSAGYISGNVEYLYRETTRLANPLVVDTTITVSSAYPYVCATFLAITKNTAAAFTGTDCVLEYMEITKI